VCVVGVVYVCCVQAPLDDASHEAMMREVLQDYMHKAVGVEA